MDANATVKIDPAKKKAKILLVEDEANIAAMVDDWLSEKYEVVIASTGKQALEKALSEKPDIILEDINLPDMLGFDVVKILEKDSKTNQIPVIFLTGEKMVEDTVKFISTVKNVKGYVNKPFRLKDFLEKIDAILSHRSEFVVLERRPATAESTGKLESVREARVQSAQAADEEEKRPAISVPGPKAAKAPASPARSGGGGLSRFAGTLFGLIFRLLLLVAVLLGGAELACRYVETFAGPWAFLPPLSASGLSLAPNSAWEQDGVSYRTNALGLRDADVAPEHSTQTFRTVLLGGTALFGRDVRLEETVSKKLEAFLSAAPVFTSTVTYQVIHAPLWGLSTERQWAGYQALHNQLQPDMVVWVAGDSLARRPLGERLKKAAAWPPWMRLCLERSRAAALLAMGFLYEGPSVPDDGGLSEKVLQFLDQNPRTPLMIVKLGGLKGLEGLTARPNLMVFGIGKSLDPDTAWTGLSARGHGALAKTLHSLLLKNKDRLRPAA